MPLNTAPKAEARSQAPLNDDCTSNCSASKLYSDFCRTTQQVQAARLFQHQVTGSAILTGKKTKVSTYSGR